MESKRITANRKVFNRIVEVQKEFHKYCREILSNVISSPDIDKKTRELLMLGQIGLMLEEMNLGYREYREQYDRNPRDYDNYLVLYSFGFKEIPIYWDMVKAKHQEYTEKIKIIAQEFQKPRKILNPYNFDTIEEYEKVWGRVIDRYLNETITLDQFDEIKKSMESRKIELGL